MKHIRGGITAPKGFLAGGITCGIKAGKKKDLCLILSQGRATACGVFTTNSVKAAPVLVSKEHLKGGSAYAIIANSGNANCMTGPRGLKDAAKMAGLVAAKIGVKKESVLVASTGIIGRRFPIDKIASSIDRLIAALGNDRSLDAAHAIMTTDTVPKEAAVSFNIAGREVRIGGIAKGAGMIHPNMATMLSFVTTDAAIARRALDKALRSAVEKTFNSVTVDGDRSTNDTVFIMANGFAGNGAITENSTGYRVFERALYTALSELASMLVEDAEGATKLIKIYVEGARSGREAKAAAMAIANSTLFKCAVYGRDPNWGRIAAAVGYSGARFGKKGFDIELNGVKILGSGMPLKIKESVRRKLFEPKEIEVRVGLKCGQGKSTVLTCDLSHKYIDINAHYST